MQKHHLKQFDAEATHVARKGIELALSLPEPKSTQQASEISYCLGIAALVLTATGHGAEARRILDDTYIPVEGFKSANDSHTWFHARYWIASYYAKQGDPRAVEAQFVAAENMLAREKLLSPADRKTRLDEIRKVHKINEDEVRNVMRCKKAGTKN